MVLQRSLIVVSVLTLVACANNTAVYNPPPQGMAFEDLNHFKWDCEHAPEQTRFLYQQLATTTAFAFDANRRAIIYKNLNEIKTYCPQQKPKPVGCVHVREDLKNGTGQATVCNSNPHGLAPLERPVVNRWDPLVDAK